MFLIGIEEGAEVQQVLVRDAIDAFGPNVGGGRRRRYKAEDRGGRTARGSSLCSQHDPARPSTSGNVVGALRIWQLLEHIQRLKANAHCCGLLRRR